MLQHQLWTQRGTWLALSECWVVGSCHRWMAGSAWWASSGLAAYAVWLQSPEDRLALALRGQRRWAVSQGAVTSDCAHGARTPRMAFQPPKDGIRFVLSLSDKPFF